VSLPSGWKLLSGDAHPALAKDLARELGVALEPVEVTHFADGEASIRISADLRGAAVSSSSRPPRQCPTTC
jgi:phosphoribosylpyrophosphate synthetase